jgi:hypothetical protein
MCPLKDALAAKKSGDVGRAYMLAVPLMVLDPSEVTRMRATAIYAWAINKMGRHAEAYHLFSLLQDHYTRPDGKLSFVEAFMVIEQILILREMCESNLAAATLELLLRRVNSETDGETTVKIRQKIDTRLPFTN